MAFKMHCPKCGGLDFSIERDNRTFGAMAQAYELVFHCRCGKQLFGEVLLKEYDQQKKAFEDGADTLALQGTPDARVERIEDRLRLGRKSSSPPFEGFGHSASAEKRWKAPLSKSFSDDDDEADSPGERAPASSAPRSKVSVAAKTKVPAKSKAPPAAVATPRPVAAPKQKAVEPKQKAVEPKQKTAEPKPKPVRPAARGKKAPAPAKAKRRPASVKPKAAARSKTAPATRRKAASPARLKVATKAAARTGSARTRSAKVKVAAKGRAHEVHGTCIWPGCGKATRSNSKYCSRACSNKNARSRHKTRVRKSVTKKSTRTARSAKRR